MSHDVRFDEKIFGHKYSINSRNMNPKEKNECYQKIISIEITNLNFAQKFRDISKEVHDIEIGYLDVENYENLENAKRYLEKRWQECLVIWMRSLEILDGMQLGDAISMAKLKRKCVVNTENSHMDQADE